MDEAVRDHFSQELQNLRKEAEQAMNELDFAESDSANLAAMRHLNSVYSRMNDLIKRAKAANISEAVASAMEEMD